MRHIMKTILIVMILGLTAVLSAAALFFRGRGTTPVITGPDGMPLPGSIASLEKIELGGMQQWILVRGHNKANPVLLWLHGGPGSAQMPVARHYNSDLEKDFVVVHWDQRGAGKSNPKDFDESTLTLSQFVEDTHQLTQYLNERFHQDKIYLVGHSWGSTIGLKLAQSYPQDYYAYVGVSQVTDRDLSAEINYAWLLKQIKEKDNARDISRLEALGLPPYHDHDYYVNFVRLVDAYGGAFDAGFNQLTWIAVQASEYRFSDLIAYVGGMNRGSGPMWEAADYNSFNPKVDVPHLDVPVYFFCGRNDYNTPLEATEQYFNQLDAPQGKHLVVFEKSAHTPFLGEADKFRQELLKVKQDTYPGR